MADNPEVYDELQRQGFILYMPHVQVLGIVSGLADQLAKDYKGVPVLHTVTVLDGGQRLAFDLLRELKTRADFPIVSHTVKAKSYEGEHSTGRLKIHSEPAADLKGLDILLIEDIVDTGITLHGLEQHFKHERGVASVESAVLLDKPSRRILHHVRPKYVGVEIPNLFVVGYGLDLDGKFREANGIWYKP